MNALGKIRNNYKYYPLQYQHENIKINKLKEKLINEIFNDWLDYDEKQNNVYNKINDTKELKKLKEMPYKKYLQTEHWDNKRKGALYRAKYKCQLCSDKENLQVHHNTYENRGQEKDEDLVVLCEICHAKFHNKISQSSKLEENKRIVEELRELGIDDEDIFF